MSLIDIEEPNIAEYRLQYNPKNKKWIAFYIGPHGNGEVYTYRTVGGIVEDFTTKVLRQLELDSQRICTTTVTRSEQ